jgi:hypothetical protein
MEVMVTHRKASACALMESAVRKRTKAIGFNDFPKIRISDPGGVFAPFTFVERVRRIVGKSRYSELSVVTRP